MRTSTKIVMLGRHPEEHHGVVNTPVYHASTILFPSLAALDAAEQKAQPTYARQGTPSSQDLEAAVAALEGADRAMIFPSGLAAISSSLMAFLGAGDHVLISDNVYRPTRRFCDAELTRFGVTTTYYPPGIGAGIREWLQPNTKVVYVESPGSHTFEMEDIPALAEVAHRHGAVVLADNTWATPLYFAPFEHGVDVSIHSATKYIGGHSDLIMGIVTARKTHEAALRRMHDNLGMNTGAESCFLALRGFRSMGVRLRQHQESALAVAAWLQKQPEVAEVRYPALPGSVGHDIWKRDMTGACGLFSILLHPCRREALASFVDGLEHFGIGYSWGGYESLIVYVEPARIRTATPWKHPGPVLRLHIGLEDPADLIEDLEAGLMRLRQFK